MTLPISYQKTAKWDSDSSSDSSGFDDDSDHKFDNKADQSNASSYSAEEISKLWDSSSSGSSSDESQDSSKNTTNRWTSSSDSSDSDSSKSFLTQDTQDKANPPNSEDNEPFDNWSSSGSTDSSDSDEDQIAIQHTTAYSTDLTNFNQIIQEKMKGICLIIAPSPRGTGVLNRGTGVLIGSDLLITNHHVIPNERIAAKSQAVFFKYRKEKTVQFELTPELDLNPYERNNGFFVTSPRRGTIDNPQSVDKGHLDYTIVALKHTEALAKVYTHALSLFHSVKPSINDHISLIQHPDVLTTDRLVKGKLCFDVGSVTKVFDCEVRYNAKAAPGSSGGALINTQGDFIALHYQGKKAERLGVRTSMIRKDLSKKKKLGKVKSRTTVPLESILEAKLKECLKKSYKARQTLTVLNMQDDGDFEYHLPIEHAYTRLAMIKGKERDEQNQKLKNEKLSVAQDLRPITHEAIFNPKEEVLPNEIWKAKELKSKVKRIVAFGSAGSGKTTFCHHISYKWAQGKLWNEDFEFLFWMPLRNLEKYEHNDIYQILAKECGVDQEELIDLLKQKKVRKKSLLILDGYDELSVFKEGLFKQFKENFFNILLTSRPDRVMGFNQEAELEILGFNGEGIGKYINAYFKHCKKILSDQERTKRKENLKNELEKEPTLKSLASIPINLTLLCALFFDRKETFKLDHPATISSIYVEITDWLCKRFLVKYESNHRKKDVIDLSNPFDINEAKPIGLTLEALAWKATCEKDGSLYLSSRDIGKCLKKTTETLLKKMGIFRIQKREGHFIHLTFQEFFAAKHLARYYLEGCRQKAQNFVRKNKFNPRYRLMLSMTSGCLSLKENTNALKDFFEDLFAAPRDLARGYELVLFARCFEECNNPEKIIPQYKTLIQQATKYIRTAPLQEMNFQLLNRNIRLLHNPSIVTALLENLSENPKQKEATHLISRFAKEKMPIPNKIIATLSIAENFGWDHSQWNILSTLLNIAKEGQAGAKKALAGLIRIVSISSLDTDFWDVQSVAADSLGEIAKGRQAFAKEALNALIKVANNPSINHYIRRSAANALAKIDTKEALDALIKMINNSSLDRGVRNSATDAIEVVAKEWQTLPNEVLNALIKVANNPSFDRNDQSSTVKAKKGLPRKVLDALITILNNSSLYRDVRSSAANALGDAAKGGQAFAKKDLDALINMANNPSDSSIQKSATNVLEEVAKEGQAFAKEALGALINMVNNSSLDRNIRGSAANALGMVAKEGQTEAKEALGALINMVNNSSLDRNIRGSAANALGMVAKEGQTGTKEALDTLIKVAAIPATNKSNSLINNGLSESGLQKTFPQNTQGKLVKSVPGIAFKVANSPSIDQSIRRSAAKALGNAAKGGQVFAKKALDALINMANSPSDSSIQKSSTNALEEVAKEGQAFAKEALGALINMVNNSSLDRNIQESAANALGMVAKEGQTEAKEALDTLINIASSSSLDRNIQGSAIKALEEVAKKGQAEAKEALDTLINIANNSSLDRNIRGSAVKALEEVAKKGQAETKEALDTLIKVANSPSLDWDVTLDANSSSSDEYMLLDTNSSSSDEYMLFDTNNVRMCAAEALARIAKEGALPKETLDALINMANNPSLGRNIQRSAANALEEAARGRQAFSEEALEALINMTNNPSLDRNVRSSVADAIEAVARRPSFLKELLVTVEMCFCSYKADEKDIINSLGEIKSSMLAKEVAGAASFLDMLKLCYLTQRGLTISEEQITISDRQNKESFDIKKSYLNSINPQQILTSSYSSAFYKILGEFSAH
ncbi:HEAT repeat domain-containing protein [Candidatus Neptunochlamydia vexilliferae]|uniref:Serine protease n=1 Tax=Candidatus Neptunichlamydia vexilliferae TaxID=1651774 RepID=A0ABS0AY31_9BACT|nr:HEAT repeat domain-containing protein [Candidatus Neptunochlamydia vexilliferae]MBF5059045.1 hypothetical protein [Candidatus Neptunochlamydia vexilliferae]